MRKMMWAVAAAAALGTATMTTSAMAFPHGHGGGGHMSGGFGHGHAAAIGGMMAAPRMNASANLKANNVAAPNNFARNNFARGPHQPYRSHYALNGHRYRGGYGGYGGLYAYEPGYNACYDNGYGPYYNGYYNNGYYNNCYYNYYSEPGPGFSFGFGW
ncbi:MAG: hypothetical protein WAM75_14615 [Xanthobacteraceae bacterium]